MRFPSLMMVAWVVLTIAIGSLCAGCGGGSNGGATSAFPGQEVSNAQTPTQLGFTTGPVDTVVHQPLPAVQVSVLDALGRPTLFEPVVQLALGDNPAGGVLSGTLTVTAHNGIATFSDLRLDTPGGYTLVATSVNLSTANSVGFNITAVGPPSQLVFVTDPSTTPTNTVMVPAVHVAVEDVNGSVLAEQVTGLTVSLTPNPQNAVLTGTLSVNTVNGVATFNNLQINQPGTYTLEVTTTAGVTVTSIPFDIQ